MAALSPIMALPEVIDVDDLREIGRSVRRAVSSLCGRTVGWSPGASLAATGAKMSRPWKLAETCSGLPVDVPRARRPGAALHELEQAVSRADIPPAVRLED